MATTYQCSEHGEIAESALLWVTEEQGTLITWRTPESARIYPTCPRCGRQVGQTIRNTQGSDA